MLLEWVEEPNLAKKIDQFDAHTGFLRYWEQRAGREQTFGKNFQRIQGQV